VTSASFYMRSARAKRTGAVATRVSRARKKGRHLFRSVDGDGQELNDASNTAMKSFDDEFTSDHVVEDGIANKFDGGKIETMVQTGDDKKVGGKQVLVFTILSAGFLTILFLVAHEQIHHRLPRPRPFCTATTTAPGRPCWASMASAMTAVRARATATVRTVPTAPTAAAVVTSSSSPTCTPPTNRRIPPRLPPWRRDRPGRSRRHRRCCYPPSPRRCRPHHRHHPLHSRQMFQAAIQKHLLLHLR